MGLRINTNVASLVAQRSLSRATEVLNKSYQRLATGRRIVNASDDPAGLAISARLEARIRGTDQAIRNANDGLSVLAIAEGSLTGIAEAVTRARELAVQSANGTLSSSDRASLQNEFSQIQQLIDQLAQGSTFNGINLLNGSTASISFQVGAGTTTGIDTLSVSLSSATGSAIGVASLDISTVGGATAAIAALDTAITTLGTQRASIGASQFTLESRISALDTLKTNLTAANSRIMDVDIARETAELTRASIIQQSALAVLSQANQQPSIALALLNSTFARN